MLSRIIPLLFSGALLWAQATAPTMTVDATANRHAINPDIYGIYGLDPTFAKEIKLPNTRWGGDAATRYNWQVDSSNSGFDWYYTGGSGTSSPIASAGPDSMIRVYQPAGTRALITIPIIPYIDSTSAWNCSFPVSVYGPQQSVNPYIHPNNDNCGNGIATDGARLMDRDIFANHISNTPKIQQGWIGHLVSTFGNAASGGVTYYQLDNEPGGWGNTHRDVEPVGATYDTIFSLGSEYASMIKATDPTAKVLGPSDFTLGGWVGSTADLQKHNGLYAGQWYLQQMQAYQKANGKRILDYFDEHVYGGSTSDDAYELESTQSLWDPSYNSKTWVEQYYLGNMQLIPRFHSWIQQYYPGTKLAFSEYSWGGHNTLVGALAEADILGIFGRQQVDFADMWDPPKPDDPTAYIFRLYRNYDGKGNEYGDTWVDAASSDQRQLAIYGAQRTGDGALTLVVINKAAEALSGSIALLHFNPVSSATFYTYSSANLKQIVEQPALAVVNSLVTASFPARSASMIVVHQATMPLTPTNAPLVRTNWRATASIAGSGAFASYKETPASAIDNNIESRWSTGHPQAVGAWFEVDMGKAQTFSKVTLDGGLSVSDYPRGYQLFVSNDGQNWGTAVAGGVGSGAFVTIGFPVRTARYLKIVLTASDPQWWWSIAELNVLP